MSSARTPGDRYGGWGADVLSSPPARSRRRTTTDAAAEPGLVVEDVETGWCGAVVRVEKSGGVHVVVLEDRAARTRTFPLGPGFLLDGAPVRLVAPVRRHPAPGRGGAVHGGAAHGGTAHGGTAHGGTAHGGTGPGGGGRVAPGRTASGSVAVSGRRARVARGSRIWVEGRHDAELVEKVWGDDLRVEGVVVEGLEGVDNLEERLAAFGPGPGRRVGVLVDHLLTGTKEDRVVEGVLRAVPGAREHVLVVGHPFVDVWQAVRPHRLGVAAWPVVPRGRPWKEGVLAGLGWPHASQADVAQGWRRILAGVETLADLEPTLSGRVEQLIDFVTGDALDR